MSSPTVQAAPFTRATVNAMRKLYPESLADKSFDNTGLLLEAPGGRQGTTVLLTVDLTKAVADEAIRRKDSIIIAYHPIIFRGLKSLTLNDPQQQSLLRLAAEGISVYSPHTAIDAAPGGMADWLCDIVTGSQIGKPGTTGVPSSLNKTPRSSYNYSQPTQPLQQSGGNYTPLQQPIEHTRTTIHPNPSPPPGFENAGMGRLVTFSTPQFLPSLIDLIGSRLGHQPAIPVATPQNKSIEDITIRTVGICPGSGSGVLLGGKEVPDLLLTGEMTHHDALGAIERGSSVISLFHSNSERGYLANVMREKLQAQVELEWESLQREESLPPNEGRSSGVSVDVSCKDRDPYGVVLLQN
ncbi:hypothetical protein FQN54_000555 [Arachnomyces sp. PD_36]|nr:hypothetical protein FQN54_000555 [Arachnomyces sp. PD_36]